MGKLKQKYTFYRVPRGEGNQQYPTNQVKNCKCQPKQKKHKNKEKPRKTTKNQKKKGLEEGKKALGLFCLLRSVRSRRGRKHSKTPSNEKKTNG